MQLTTFAIDSALGRWTHHEWCAPQLPPPLAGLVDTLWHFEGRTTLPRERNFPGGHLELIVHLGPRFRAVGDDGVAADLFPLACLTGVQTAPVVIEAPAAECRVLGVRLYPLGAHALLAGAAAELVGRTIDLEAVAGRATRELAERCHDAATVPACFRQAAAWLAARIAAGSAPHPGIAWAAARLEQSRGAASVTRLRAESGLGRTRFAELFRAQLGLGPKRYARLLRFRHALVALQHGAPVSAAALDAGYCDQPHLHADFREFARMTPAAFVRATRYHNAPSLAEPA